jgi:WD40 repeat protein
MHEDIFRILPLEMLFAIFKYLDEESLKQVGYTCKLFNRVANDKMSSPYFYRPLLINEIKGADELVSSPDKKSIATTHIQDDSGTLYYSIKIWDAETGANLDEINLGTTTIYKLAFGHDALLYATHTSTLHVYYLQTKIQKSIPIGDGVINSIHGLPNGNFITVISGADHTGFINWRLDCWKSNGEQHSVPLGRGHRDSKQLFSLKTEVLGNGDVIVVIPTEGVVKRWDQNFEERPEFHIGKSPQGNCINNPIIKGKHLLFLRDEKIEVWNLASHNREAILQYPEF